MKLLLAAVMLASALGAAAAPAARKAKMDNPGKRAVDESFEILAPAGWSVDRKADGFLLGGPSADGVPARIIVRWVRPDHALYTTPEAYMARLSRPTAIPMRGWKNGAVEGVTAAGRKALRLERDTTDFVPPESMAPKEVKIREEHVAVPAAKGFYLIVYSAPLSLDAALRPLFRRMVEKSFKPRF